MVLAWNRCSRNRHRLTPSLKRVKTPHPRIKQLHSHLRIQSPIAAQDDIRQKKHRQDMIKTQGNANKIKAKQLTTITF